MTKQTILPEEVRMPCILRTCPLRPKDIGPGLFMPTFTQGI